MADAGTGVIEARVAATAAAGTACAAVVVHYRDAASTLRCVASLRAQEPAPFVVVVDNASPDGSGETLRRALDGASDVQVVTSPHNHGFGSGCNRGIDHVLETVDGVAHVLLLNPDAELAPRALAEMRATLLRHPRAVVVGCRIDDEHGRPWFVNGRIPRHTLRGFHAAATGADEHPTEFVTGACMLLDARALRRGLRFDESFFLYCEDADLCVRVRQAGGELWLTQRARCRHVGGGSQPGAKVLGECTAERLYWLTRAKGLFARRHLGPLEFVSFVAVALLLKPLAGLALSRSPRFLVPYLRGLRDGLLARSRRAHAPAVATTH